MAHCTLYLVKHKVHSIHVFINKIKSWKRCVLLHRCMERDLGMTFPLPLVYSAIFTVHDHTLPQIHAHQYYDAVLWHSQSMSLAPAYCQWKANSQWTTWVSNLHNTCWVHLNTVECHLNTVECHLNTIECHLNTVECHVECKVSALLNTHKRCDLV